MDRIIIRNLRLRTVIGIYPEERREKQDIVINVVLYSDLKSPASSDNINDAVDYKEIKKSIIKLTETTSFHLIETLAEKIAQLCLNNEKVVSVDVTIDKPGALRFADSVAVEIKRKKKYN